MLGTDARVSILVLDFWMFPYIAVSCGPYRDSSSNSSLYASEFLGQAIGKRSPVLFLEILGHALEAEFVGGLDVVDNNSIGHVCQ